MVSSSEVRYAVALLFDISGVFDNVWWLLVLDSLKDRNCPKNVFEVLQSYFRDRNVQIELVHEVISKKVTISSWPSLGTLCLTGYSAG